MDEKEKTMKKHWVSKIAPKKDFIAQQNSQNITIEEVGAGDPSYLISLHLSNPLIFQQNDEFDNP